MKAFKAYALQFESKPCSFSTNYSTLLSLLNFVEENSLVVIPEVAATGFCYSSLKEAVSFSEKVFKELLDFSKALSLTVVLTGLELVNGKLFNSVKVFDRGRELLSRGKVKLFRPGGEEEFFERGNLEEVKAVETSLGVVIAPLICFELRFCEVLTALKEQGGEVFTVSAQWGRARKEHWECLIKSRAIEFQRFFVGANGNGREMAGGSTIVDPWGRVLAYGGDALGVIEGEISPSVIVQVERKLPLNS
ncbi:nitrilase-related carbon-nitrogen hydrolase [Thermovibrio sp.]